MKRRARRQREVAPERDEPTHRPPACASQADRVGRHRERGTGRLDRRNAPIRSFRPCAGSLMDPARPGEKPGIDHDGVGCWPAATPPTRADTVTRRSRAQPPRLRALSGDNHLITRAYGSLRRGETLGRKGPSRRHGWRERLSLVADQRHRPGRAGIVTPLRTVRKKRERRPLGASAFSVNRGGGAFCNGPKNSGGTRW